MGFRRSRKIQRISKKLYNSFDGIIIIYIIGDKDSFELIKNWIYIIKETTESSKIGIIIIKIFNIRGKN